MVGVVLVSHSQELASALAAYTKMMAPHARVVAAGGLPDGSFGTSYQRIKKAIEDVREPDGAVVIVDMGSAILTTRMALDDLNDPRVRLADCPFVEGAVQATVLAQSGAGIDEIVEELAHVHEYHKLDGAEE